MHTTAAIAAFFAGLAIAVPASPRAANYKWSVTGWTASYSAAAGSKFAFNIAAAAAAAEGSDPAIPALNAHCTGGNPDGPVTQYIKCSQSGVVARLLQPQGSQVPVEVSFAWAADQPDTFYNLTGSAKTTYTTGATLSFAITPQFVQQN